MSLFISIAVWLVFYHLGCGRKLYWVYCVSMPRILCVVSNYTALIGFVIVCIIGG